MIELPSHICPQSVSPMVIDFGGNIEPSTGAAITRVDRAGNRFAVSVSLPPLTEKDGRIVVSRLIRAKSEGIRIHYPLLGVSQGLAGSPVVDGAGQTGNTINLRGLTPYYSAKEGFWVSFVKDEQHYLHNVAGNATADASGDIALPISPILRTEFADGSAVHLEKPCIEGIVEGQEWQWALSVDRLISIEFMIKEAA